MSPQAWTTIGVVALILALLSATRIAADVVLLAGVTLLLLLGVVTPREALSGMSNEGMITVGILYVVVAGLEGTGATAWIVQRLLGRPKSVLQAQAKLMAPVTAMSAFLNNTPVVAMFMPAVNDWARQNRISVSKLMIPLSYAAVLGGVCTLIGTSTNLVVNGLFIEETQGAGFGMFDIALVGLAAAAVGSAFIMLTSRKLLPDRKPVLGPETNPREYSIEMMVEPASPLVGKTIEQAGLRHLVGMYLAEIERGGEIIPAVGPQEVLRADDRLVFVGVVESVVDLQKIRGLKPATNQVFKLDAPRTRRVLIEAVVSGSCPLIGKTIRDGRFRSVYNAVVIAVARNGQRVRKKIGDIVLQPGDNLLVEAHPSFADQMRNSRDYYLVSRIEKSTPPRHEKAILAVAIMVGMVAAVTMEWLSMLEASMLAAGLMLVTRCCTSSEARASVEWQVLLAIAASFGVGRALEVSGAASTIAGKVIAAAGGNPWLTLAVVYGVTVVMTELITNNAAAVLVFPIAYAAALNLGVDVKPFVVCVMMAASLGFATPMGYQTHMMVYGPGGYKFSDFLRIGAPMDLMMGVVVVLTIPLIWPLAPVTNG